MTGIRVLGIRVLGIRVLGIRVLGDIITPFTPDLSQSIILTPPPPLPQALFRPMSMMIPDYALVAEVMLFSEGFNDAKNLSKKMVQLYKLASEQLSQQVCGLPLPPPFPPLPLSLPPSRHIILPMLIPPFCTVPTHCPSFLPSPLTPSGPL